MRRSANSGQADGQPTCERLERCHRRKTASPRDAAVAELTGCPAGKRLERLTMRRSANTAKPTSGWRAPRALSPKKNCVASRRGGCRADGLPGGQAPRATNYAPKREYGQADELLASASSAVTEAKLRRLE